LNGYALFRGVLYAGLSILLLSISDYPLKHIWGFFCPVGAADCYGTPGDDLIQGTTDNAIIHGLGGNDYIRGFRDGYNIIFGGDGNDTLIGGFRGDYLEGGMGNDKYDGSEGDDTIQDFSFFNKTSMLSEAGNDVISGGSGNDYIIAHRGHDIIHGGPGSDHIDANLYFRDFSPDFVDCGFGYDSVNYYHSEDIITAFNCENDIDFDY
jgi:hypothetical protein